MRRVALIALVAGVTLASGAVAARAPSSTTRIVLDHSSRQSGSGTNAYDFVGHLESRRRACVPGRTVRVVLHSGNTGALKVLDRDRTGKDGAWAVGGNIVGADVAHFRVKRKAIGGRKHRRICKADSTSIRFV